MIDDLYKYLANLLGFLTTITSFYIQSSEAKMPLNIFGGQKIKGTVVLMQKNVLDINSIISAEKIADGIFDGVTSIFDTLTSFLGRSISLQLISATQADCKFFNFTYACTPIYI